jgi:hypothetical protein
MPDSGHAVERNGRDALRDRVAVACLRLLTRRKVSSTLDTFGALGISRSSSHGHGAPFGSHDCTHALNASYSVPVLMQ